MTLPLLTRSIALFLLAGLCEIGGGYLVWQWWRAGAHWALGAAGALVLGFGTFGLAQASGIAESVRRGLLCL